MPSSLRNTASCLRELHRVTKPGRLTAVHCSDMPRTKSTHGEIGLYDMPGDIIRAHKDAGWTYHSRITIWKDPVVEMQRTKALGCSTSNCRRTRRAVAAGLAGLRAGFSQDADDDDKAIDPVGKDKQHFPVSSGSSGPPGLDGYQSDQRSQRAAAREDKDEKHLCPLQLDLIERAIRLWSNEGDTVLSPFMGIGSEGYGALKCGRRFVGAELKAAYYRQAMSQPAAQGS
jgi:DNA modification methylase